VHNWRGFGIDFDPMTEETQAPAEVEAPAEAVEVPSGEQAAPEYPVNAPVAPDFDALHAERHAVADAINAHSAGHPDLEALTARYAALGDQLQALAAAAKE
jgi:hypothetical protein